MPEKCLLIIMDGLGDRSHEQLMHQTPLQAARTPVLDNLAGRGANGIYHASIHGQALSSESAHFAIFGYDKEEFPGRGALEAIGSGIELGPRDVAVLAHLVSLTEKDGHLLLERNKPFASVREIDEIVGAIGSYDKKGVEVRYFPTGGINGIVVLKGNVSPCITDSDPMREGSCLSEIKPWHDSISNRAARITAEVLRSYLLWIYRQLEKHPVNLSRKKEGMLPLNGIVTQRAGQLRSVSPIHERYGIRGISIASGIVYHGLGGYLGLDVQKVTDTGDPGRDIAERLRLARALQEEYDFIHIHTKAPDEAAHTKDPIKKKEVVEQLDIGIGEEIGSFIEDSGILIVITSDHSTPSVGPLIHSGEPVPLTICGRGVRRDEVSRFDEVSVATGALGCLRGRELIYLILNYLDRAKLVGIMDSPVDQAFWPGNYDPFRVD